MVMDAMKLSDADALLQASATPTMSAGPVLQTTLPVAQPTYPVPGGAVGAVNTATLDTGPQGGGVDLKALLWVGAGIGTAWLLTRSDRSVSGAKKQNWLVPALILGAGAAWYLFGDKLTGAAATNPEKDWLLNTFHATNEQNQQAMLAAIPNMSDTEIHYLYLRAASQIPGSGITLSDADKAGIEAMMAKFGLAGL